MIDHVKYAEYAEYKAKVTIDTLEIHDGELPRRVFALVLK